MQSAVLDATRPGDDLPASPCKGATVSPLVTYTGFIGAAKL